MMYCPNCGKKLEDGMAFCPECGKKIPVSAGAGQPLPGGSEIPVTKEEAQTLLEEILSSLSAEEQEILWLRYGGERTAAQIAEELGIPETEAQERLARAQKRSESKILEMEKRGTKLYSLAPLPFLAMLFKAYGVEASEGGAWQKERAESASEDTAKSSPENNAAKSAAESDAVGNAGIGADSTGAGAAETGSGAGTAAESAGAQSAAAGAGAGTTASGVGAAGTAGQAAAGAAAAGAAAGISAKTVAVIAVIAAACVGGGALALTQGGSSTAKTIEEQWQEQYDAGAQYLEEGEYEEAVSAFSEAIELIEEEEDAWIGRGTAYALLGDAGSAAADCETVLSLEDLSAEDYIQTAEVYEILEDYEEALSVLEEGLLLYEEEETLLAKQGDITQLSLTQQFVNLYLDDLLAVAEMLWENPESMGGTDWFGDDLRSFLDQIEETIVVEVDDDMVLAAYSGGYIYYGNMEEGVRSGQGVWFISYSSAEASALMNENHSVSENLVYMGEWAEDYPNGYGEYYSFVPNMYMETAMLELAISFTDGYADGEGLLIADHSEVTWNNTMTGVVGSCAIAFDYGEPSLIYGEDDGSVEYALIEDEDGTTLTLTMDKGTYLSVSGATKEADRTAAEDETEGDEADEETEGLVFDTSAQIEETVLYDANGIVITATELLYSEETVSLMLRVENNTDGYICVLNQTGGDGVPYDIEIAGTLFKSPYLGTLFDSAVPAGETEELSLSLEIENLLFSGVAGVPDFNTGLDIYRGEISEYLLENYGEEIVERTEYLDSFDVELSTTIAGSYDYDTDLFREYILSDVGEEALGYTILAADYDIPSAEGAYYSAASIALIEEDDGALTFIYELDETSEITWWELSLSINGISVSDYESYWTSNIYGTVGASEGHRRVIRYGISAEDREKYGLETITSAGLAAWDDGEEVLHLDVD